MIRGKDIVIVGLQPWDIAIGSNCKNIALELAKHNRVLYVNPPLDRSTYLRKPKNEQILKRLRVIKNQEAGLVQISENLWNLYPKNIAESINWISNRKLFNMLNLVNNRRLASDIKTAITDLGFQDFILFNDQSMIRCYYLNKLLSPAFFIYYIRDNLSTIPYFKKHALKMETDLIAEADAVATNSDFLATYAADFNQNVKMVGQGCDFSLFEEPEKIGIANELSSIPKPIIGYVGYLTEVRLDISLIEHIAISRPNWQVVLVGPEDEAFRNSNLHQLKNVHFLGNKNPDSLPTYIKGFDVAINPQLINEVTMGNYPRKIDEYLAMGKPTVATKTSFMDYFRDYTYLAATPNEYVACIEKALRDNKTEFEQLRRKFALTHTWENNVEAISRLIRKVELGKTHN
jgi:glycosyltransferase involved in cell wall biosynthesis